MPLTLSSELIEKKNSLSATGAWIILIEIVLTRYYLFYDGLSGSFLLGDEIVGGTTGSKGTIVDLTSGGTTGTVYVFPMEGQFEDNETITGNIQGSADVNGNVHSEQFFWTWARNNETVFWNGSTYLENAIEISNAKQDVQGRIDDLQVSIANINSTFEQMVIRHNGFPGMPLKLTLIHSEYQGLSETDKVFEETYYINSCSMTYEWISFTVGMEPVFSQRFPRYKYEWSPCRYQYRDSSTCQDSGTSCVRLLDGSGTDCGDNNNQRHYGAFPAIPGGKF